MKLILKLIVSWDLWLKIQFQCTWRVLAMWLHLFGQLKVAFSAACTAKQNHLVLIFYTYSSIYDSWSWITLTVKVKIILRLIVPWDLWGSCDVFTSIWSVEGSILSSIQGRAKPSGVNILQLWFLRWLPGGYVCRAEPPGGHFWNNSCKSLTPEVSIFLFFF